MFDDVFCFLTAMCAVCARVNTELSTAAPENTIKFKANILMNENNINTIKNEELTESFLFLKVRQQYSDCR